MRNVIIVVVVFVLLVGILAVVFGTHKAVTVQNGLASIDQVPLAQQGLVQTMPGALPPQYVTVPTAYYVPQPAAATQSATVGNNSDQNAGVVYVAPRRIVRTYPAATYDQTDPNYVYPAQNTSPSTVTYPTYPNYPAVPTVPQVAPAATRHYVYTSVNSCQAVSFSCSYGERLFSDVSGCGCEIVRPVRRYLQRDPNVCQRVQFSCENNENSFSDSSGCGCESTP